MADVRPIRALRPRDELAASVIAPPYDVLTDAEARSEAKEPNSFVHITRPEVDLPLGTDSHSDVAYAQARTNLMHFIENQVLQQDEVATYYFYGQVMGEHRQVGIIAGEEGTPLPQVLLGKRHVHCVLLRCEW